MEIVQLAQKGHKVDILLALELGPFVATCIHGLHNLLNNLSTKIHTHNLVYRGNETSMQDNESIVESGSLCNESHQQIDQRRCDILAWMIPIELFKLRQNRYQIRLGQLVQMSLGLAA